MSSEMRKLNLKDILEMTHEIDGSSLESLNESFNAYLTLDHHAKIEYIADDKLMVSGYLYGTPRAVPLYLDITEKTVSISVWETIKSIVAHKNMLIGYVPIELSTDLKNKLVKLGFVDYNLAYKAYEKRLLDFLSKKNKGGPSVFRTNTYILKEK